TFRGKPRRNGRACGRHYLRSASCAARSKAPRAPAIDTEHTGPLTGIDANGKVARASARGRFRELTAAEAAYQSGSALSTSIGFPISRYCSVWHRCNALPKLSWGTHRFTDRALLL